jgi:hypothetical protein
MTRVHCSTAQQEPTVVPTIIIIIPTVIVVPTVIVISVVTVIPWHCLHQVDTPLPLPSQVRSPRPQKDLDCPQEVLPPTGLGHFQEQSPLQGTPR